MICDLSGCAVIFPNRQENVTGYEKIYISHAMFFHFLFTYFSETLLLRGKIQRDIIISYLVIHVNYKIPLPDFTQNW